MDGDGRITVLDARQSNLRCEKPVGGRRIAVTGGGVPEPAAGLLFPIPAVFTASRLRKRRA